VIFSKDITLSSLEEDVNPSWEGRVDGEARGRSVLLIKCMMESRGTQVESSCMLISPVLS